MVDTLKEAASDGTVLWTVDRERLWAVQTPQVFRYRVLLAAHEQPAVQTGGASDDAALVLRVVLELVPTDAELGHKLLRPADLRARLGPAQGE